MSRPPKFVVVTPSLNQGKFIEETIQSVISQNYRDLDYFVVDGGSTDQTVECLKRYESKISGWISEPDSGQSEAINKGWAMCPDADIYAWINADDGLLPGALENVAKWYQANALQSHSHNIGVLAGSGFKADIDGRWIKQVSVNNISSHCPKSSFQFLQSSAFFFGSAVRNVGMLKEDLHYSMDWELVLRISQKYQIGYINKDLSYQRVYADTKTASGGWVRRKEIASIGRAYNGILDINYLMYILFHQLLVGNGRLSEKAFLARRRGAMMLRGLMERFLHPKSHMIHW
tara:strand:- start:2127 stop:2993 length:867 start_codon:yes stop_codon:yes gene_type:complete